MVQIRIFKMPSMKNIFTLLLAVFIAHFTSTALPSPGVTGDFAQLRSNLYIVSPDGSTVLMDGALTQYYGDYTNAIDGMDARKMSNMSENWGMLRDNSVYVIERRHTIEGNDSIFFKMWNMRVITYRLEFIASNLDFPGRTGMLIDKYLNTSTPINLNGTTYVDFSVVADPASKASDRFLLVFSRPVKKGLLSYNNIFANAMVSNHSVIINWQNVYEGNFKQLAIERSNDANSFDGAKTVLITYPNGQPQNQYKDEQPREGANYYRLAVTGIDGSICYSNVMKAEVAKTIQRLEVYPNPVIGDNLNLQMKNQAAGVYKIALKNPFGQLFLSREINFEGGDGVLTIRPSHLLPKGIYRLEIQSPDGKLKVIQVMF